MKTLKNIGKIALLSLALCGGTTSCNYLDVVPPEQASLPDATKDPESTLGFLFSCYGGIRNPFDYQTVEAVPMNMCFLHCGTPVHRKLPGT